MRGHASEMLIATKWKTVIGESQKSIPLALMLENITHIAVIVLEGSVNAEDAVQTEVNASQCLAQSAQVTKKPRKTETEDDLWTI